MRDLQQIAQICFRELEALGIVCGSVQAFRVNTRAKRRWGLCKILPGGYQIEIAAVLLREDIPLASLKDTIIHELLHTCPGCANHGAQWKALADKVNRAYGYNIRRLASPAEKGVPDEWIPPQRVRRRYVRKRGG